MVNPYLAQAKRMADDLRASGKPCAIGYPLLTEQNYRSTIATFADADSWPTSFAEYKAKADQQLEAFDAAGISPIGVDLNCDEFTRFRQQNGLTQIDAQSRILFCAYKVTEWAE